MMEEITELTQVKGLMVHCKGYKVLGRVVNDLVMEAYNKGIIPSCITFHVLEDGEWEILLFG